MVLSGESSGAGAAFLRLTLWALSLGYRSVIAVRNFLYDEGLLPEHAVDKPVISIGNITAGGTGKTPAVEYAVKWFAAHGTRPAILSRGYRSKDGRNDEAILLALHLPDIPHRQHKNRFRAAIQAMKLDHADVLVLDDGFQHRRLARFANVVLIDATCPFGYGHLLPRGLLREPAGSLKRADALILTRCDLVDQTSLSRLLDQLERLAPGTPKALSRHRPTAVAAYPDGAPEPTTALHGKRVSLFCSIGNPAAFRRTVEALGTNVERISEFPDHHWYTAADVADILRTDNRDPDVFVTTEKDAVKLRGLWPAQKRLMVLRVEMEILSGEKALEALFHEALHAATYEEKEQR